MVINELLKIGLEKLSHLEFSNPQLEVRLLLSKIMDKDKSYIYAFGDKEVSDYIGEEYLKLIEKRAKGYPIQYILGHTEFMGLDFYLEEGVLVPRPDTEILVQYVLDHMESKYQEAKVKVLDLGIGSGAISLSIANYAPNAYVFGVDIGDIPIKVANINKERFGLNNVEFIKGDLFQPLDPSFGKSFHIIASNPPYIPRGVILGLQTEVRDYEPRLALDGGEDGLDFYRMITSRAKEFLVDDGLLIYEIGYDQGLDVKSIMLDYGFKETNVLKDLQGLDRVVLGYC